MEAFEHLHIRPRFAFSLLMTREKALENLKAKLEKDKSCTGHVVYSHVKIDVNQSDQHYWSPQLNFDIDEHKTNSERCYMHGVIGPKPAVWTLFMFSYFIIGILGLFSGLYGLSEWSLGNSAVWALAFPASLALISTAYWVSKVGEKLGHDQIDFLKNYVKEALEIESSPPS